MKIAVYDMAGAALRQIEISDAVFAQPANEAVVHQALVAQLANSRQGTSSTKTRSEVAGSTKKLYRQKGTGRARAGSSKSGTRRGGGILFGPRPRDYSLALPKKMRRQAIRCVLSSKALDGAMLVLDEIKFDAPATKQMHGVLKALKVQKTAIIALEGANENVVKSARNLEGIITMPARQLNVADMLSHQNLVITEAALREIEELWGGAA